MAVTCSALQAAGLPCSQADRARIAYWLAANPSHGHKIVKPSLAAWGLYDGAKPGTASFTERVAAAERVLAAGDAPEIGESLLRFHGGCEACAESVVAYLVARMPASHTDDETKAWELSQEELEDRVVQLTARFNAQMERARVQGDA